MSHYTDDPLMDETRKQHQLLLEPVGTTTNLFGAAHLLYAAGCSAGDWMDPRQYDRQAHEEGFDQHMAELQEQAHAAQTEAGSAAQDDRPDQEA
ncbi:hypothetical protein [Streptomyces sp. NPDC088707]|uniref:hypothetical protein n=1 Tax=Streptomyces sp. NPDC088707 TaxID=3365871 RepID=UPI0037F4A1A6